MEAWARFRCIENQVINFLPATESRLCSFGIFLWAFQTGLLSN
jgi:hypothetical protein